MATATTAPGPPPFWTQNGHYTPTSKPNHGPAAVQPRSQPAPAPAPAPAQEQIPTADALFEALAHQAQSPSTFNLDNDTSASTPLTVHVQQLPTPRTSLSSGASSPPENLSPNSHSHSHSHSHTHHASHHHQFSHLTPTSMASAASSSSSTPLSDFQTTMASPIQHSSSSSSNNNNTTTLSHPTQPFFQPQSFPSLRSTSPALNSTLGPALYGPSSGSAASTTTAYNSTNFNGSSTFNANMGSNTLGGRSTLQAQQYNGQQSLHQQQQQEHFYDEKEHQKKNARSALNGVAAFLPPSLNQGLSKVVQSATAAIHSTSNSKMSLPSSRAGMDGGSTGLGAGPASLVDPSSARSMLLKLYKASKLPGLCLLWYLSSAVTNNIGKQIMNQFRYPVTLTFVQFVFVSLFCFLLGTGVGKFRITTIRRPTMGIIQMTAPLVGFQVVGHVFSSVAISRVPLSVVHTIKALSPLFTVVFYRVILGTTYSRAVYISLVPLTAGVMLACRLSLEFNNLVGLVCALASTLVFVTQNVFTKRILFSTKKKQALGGLGNKEALASQEDPAEEIGSNNAQKLDKINILFYSSTMAAMCMVPIWFYAEGMGLMFPDEGGVYHHTTGSVGHNSGFWAASWLLFLNGVSHFFQNIFAFSVLAQTSPVTYSIASLIKRIIVIVASIVYFHQTLGYTQWTGVCLTFWGLWLYNSAKNAAKVTPGSGIMMSTKVGRRMSRNFGRGLLDSETTSRKGGFLA